MALVVVMAASVRLGAAKVATVVEAAQAVAVAVAEMTVETRVVAWVASLAVVAEDDQEVVLAVAQEVAIAVQAAVIEGATEGTAAKAATMGVAIAAQAAVIEGAREGTAAKAATMAVEMAQGLVVVVPSVLGVKKAEMVAAA